MRQKFARVLLTVLLVLIPLGLISAQGDHAKWTLMVYLAANNNLEPNSIINLMEMAAVGSTPDVNIVAQITRPPDYQGFYGEWGGTRRFLITRSDGQLSSGDFQISADRLSEYVSSSETQGDLPADVVQKVTRGSRADKEAAALQLSIPTIETETPLEPLQLQNIEDLGDQVNSGDGQTLADFGTWAVQNYPADHYGLVVWDHGGAWTMVASDDTLGEDGIPMPALGSALQTITDAAGQKLDFIGFDACLMAQLPVLVTVAPYAAYEIGAEELVPGYGWDYTKPLQAMVSNPDITAPEFGQELVDAFNTLYSTTASDASQTYDMGVLDLSKLDGLVSSLDSFDTAVKDADDELGPISTARSNAQIFASVGEDSDETVQFSSVDLADFMRLLTNLSGDDMVKQSAQAVIDATGELVVYHKASKTLPHANGLSIYFPANATEFDQSDGTRYTEEFGLSLAGWQAFLDGLYGVASESSSSLDLTISAVSTSADAPGSIHDTPVISYTLDGQNVLDLQANIVYRLDDGTGVVLDQFPVSSNVTTEDGSEITDYPDGESQNDFYWNTKIPSLSDGTDSLLVLMRTNPDDEQHGFIQGIYTNHRTGEQNTASLLINLDTDQSSGVWAQSGSGGNAPIAQVFPRAGDTFEPSYTVIDAEGNESEVASGTTLTFGQQPFTLTDNPGPDGEYEVTLVASDAAGHQSADTAAIEVQNDGLDDTLQGFKDLGFGLSFLYPGDWTDVQVYQRQDGMDELYVTDIEGNDYLSALNFSDTTSLDEVEAKVEDEVNGIEGVTISDPTDEQVGDYVGSSLSYQYTNTDGVLVDGVAVAVYVDDTEQGYMITLEMPSDRADDLESILSEVLQSAQFYAPESA